MKREVFENIKVIPGGTDMVIDRGGFLSAVLGISVSAGEADAGEADAGDTDTSGTISVKMEHCDTEDGTFEEVADPFIGLTGPLKEFEAEAGDIVNIELDLIGCKQYVKITVTTTAPVESALVLGDPAIAPV